VPDAGGLAKAAWLKQLGVAGVWPMAGLPKTLHLDGAAEFKTRKMRRKQQIAHRPATFGIDPLSVSDHAAPSSEIDWNKPAVPFEGEIWHGRRR